MRLSSKVLFDVAFLCGCAVFAGCGSEVFYADGSSGTSSATAGAAGGSQSGGDGGTTATGTVGTPCSFLVGSATLTSWNGDDATYAKACYSFEFASQDESITLNDWDVLYENNEFIVNTVVDDKSYIVDLGDVALADVPATVNVADYPISQAGTHDDIEAVLNHTYFVYTNDSNTQQYAAFTVTSLSPGQTVTLSWEKSVDPTKMVIPTQCD